MAERHMTGIQWTHVPGYIGATWNPTTGCTRVSPGCDHCYAFTVHDQRFVKNKQAAIAAGFELLPDGVRGTQAYAARAAGVSLPFPPQYDRPFSQVQVLGAHRLTEPLRKRKPHAYFVDSMADLFHEDVPDEAIDRVFAVMALSPQHLFMVLTKRPERMRAYITSDPAARRDRIAKILREDFAGVRDRVVDGIVVAGARAVAEGIAGGWRSLVLDNLWLGTSVEDQARADERIPALLDTPAAVRFLSCEPLLEAVDLKRFQPFAYHLSDNDGLRFFGVAGGQINWVIVGGESGAHARPFDLAWARSLVQQCQAAGVAVFVKQLGLRPGEQVHDRGGGWCEVAQAFNCLGFHGPRLKNRHGSNPDEWPEDLRVRQFPAGHADWFSQIAPAEVPA